MASTVLVAVAEIAYLDLATYIVGLNKLHNFTFDGCLAIASSILLSSN